MIARDITGGVVGGAGQLFDLINLLSNPQAYDAKLKELQSATDEYKKYIAVVGHVDEILELRKLADADAAETKAIREKAANEYDAAMREASSKAEEVLAHARSEAADVLAEAKRIKKEAVALFAGAESRSKDLDSRAAELAKLFASLETKQRELDVAILAANEEKAAAVQLRESFESFLAKQKDLLESI